MTSLIETAKAWQELIGSLIGFGAAITTFLLTERRKRLHQFRGIFKELSNNKAGIDEFLAGSNIDGLIERLRKEKLKRPHWRFSPTTRFYEAHAANLSLPLQIQDDVIVIYNEIFTASADIESVNSEAFLEISDTGREKGLRRRYEDLERLSPRIRDVLCDMRRFRPADLKLPRGEE